MIYDLYGQLGKLMKLYEESKLKRDGTALNRKLPGHTLYHFWVSYYSTMT